MSTYGGSTEIPLLDSLISNAVTPGSDISTSLSPEDREDISFSFMKVRQLLPVTALCSCLCISLGGVHVYPLPFANLQWNAHYRACSIYIFFTGSSSQFFVKKK